MSQRIGYRQELANRYLEYMRQAEVADQPQQPSATPDQETVHEASRDGLAYRRQSDALKPSLKNSTDVAMPCKDGHSVNMISVQPRLNAESPASGIAPMVASRSSPPTSNHRPTTKSNPRNCSRENC